MRFFILLLLTTLSFPDSLYPATLRGRVNDSSSGEELVGSTIFIKELSQGTISGLDGTYLIKDIPAGTYTITCSYISYEPIEKIITIVESDILTLNFQINSISAQLNEVTIIGKSDKGSETGARHSEKKADQVINAVSAKTIELSPDLTVASVIQRISGVTLERNATGDGQYAILRGMDKRFSYTMINGVKIPGTNNKYRYVPLDIFPSFLVDRLEVTKSLTPDLEGDAIGGVVNMIMKDAPARWKLNLNLTTGYNQLFIGREFISFNYKAISMKSPYEIHGSNYTAGPNDFTNKNLDLIRMVPMPNLSCDFSAGSRFFKGRLGVMLAGSVSNSFRGNKSILYGTENDTTNLPEITGKSSRNISEQYTQIGLHNIIDYQLNNQNKIILYNAYMNFTSEQVRESEGTDLNNSSNSLHSYSLRYRLNHQKLLSTVLQGEHNFTDKIKLQRSGVHGLAKNATPDCVNLSLFNEITNNIKLPLTVSNGGSTRRWEHNTDEDWAGYFKVLYSPLIAGIPFDISIGGLHRNKRRTSFFNEYRFFSVLNTDYKSIQGRDWNNLSDIKWKSSVDLNNTDPLNFNAWEIISAGYFQFKFRTEKLQVIGGLRAENTGQSYFLVYTKGDVPPIGKQIYTDLLPGLHLKYMPFEKQNLRISYYRSVNRPGFLEIVPYLVVSEEYTEMGNPKIKHTVADNIDIRYEYFPKPMDQFMVGVFYKNIQNPIEYGWSNPMGSKGNIYYMPDNFGNAKNLGMEIDLIKYFRFLGIKANYTYVNSEITTWKRYRVRKESGWQLDSLPQTRPLFGQSANVANLTLLFKDTRNGWDAQLSGNYTGDRIFLISRFFEDDQWQKGSFQLDAAIEKKFKNGLCFFAKAKNLLNSPMEVYIKKINPVNDNIIDQDPSGKSTIIRTEYYMQSYQIGIRYELK